eukprot:1140636-Pelagomonas_calceolata.AAC.2
MYGFGQPLAYVAHRKKEKGDFAWSGTPLPASFKERMRHALKKSMKCRNTVPYSIVHHAQGWVERADSLWGSATSIQADMFQPTQGR